MIGRAQRMTRTTCTVQWDDVVVRELAFEHLELHGNNLRAAETQTKAQEEANNQNRAGESSRTRRNLGERLSAVEVNENESDTDVDEPLSRIVTLRPFVPAPPLAPPGDSETESEDSKSSLRVVRSSLAVVLVVVLVDDDVDVAVPVVVVDVNEVEVAVTGSKLRPTSLLLESSPSIIRIPRKMMIRLLGKRMCRGI